MDISVIIPTHLPINKTRELIDSCVKQLHTSDELILVIDNPEFVDGYKDTIPHGVKLITNKENIGAASSRNKGISLARKDIIVFLDSDSVIPNDLIESHRAAHINSEEDIVVAGKTHFNDIGAWYDTWVKECDFFLNGYCLRMKTTNNELMFAPTSNISAPITIYKALPFNERFPKNGGGEDNLWCLAVRNSYKIYDLAHPISQDIWAGFFNGVVRRLLRWGSSEVIVVDELLNRGLTKYVKNDQSQTSEFLLNFPSGQTFFSAIAPRIHRIGYVMGCFKYRKLYLLNKYINHSGKQL